jgi:hypothetical protein
MARHPGRAWVRLTAYAEVVKPPFQIGKLKTGGNAGMLGAEKV